MISRGLNRHDAQIRLSVSAIWTAAVEMMAGDQSAKNRRTVDIVADAFYHIVTQDSKTVTGNFFVDETVLRDAGVQDFEQYALEPGNPLIMDGFIDEELTLQDRCLDRIRSRRKVVRPELTRGILRAVVISLKSRGFSKRQKNATTE